MCSPSDGGVAEWSCSGLQLRVRRFDSDLRLQIGNARVVKSVDTGDLKSPAHKACQFESGLGHHFSVHEIWCKKFQRKLVFLYLKFRHKKTPNTALKLDVQKSKKISIR